MAETVKFNNFKNLALQFQFTKNFRAESNTKFNPVPTEVLFLAEIGSSSPQENKSSFAKLCSLTVTHPESETPHTAPVRKIQSLLIGQRS